MCSGITAPAKKTLKNCPKISGVFHKLSTGKKSYPHVIHKLSTVYPQPPSCADRGRGPGAGDRRACLPGTAWRAGQAWAAVKLVASKRAWLGVVMLRGRVTHINAHNFARLAAVTRPVTFDALPVDLLLGYASVLFAVAINARSVAHCLK